MLVKNKCLTSFKVYQHLSQTSQFPCLAKTMEEESPDPPFKCIISFEVMYKIDGSDDVQVCKKTVTGRHLQKKQAKKAAWNIVIQETYKILSALPQSKLRLTKN